ncbi:MAG TPA: nucleotidyl transferase AbiEii/AbiGii toxin family protein [Anaerolineae bacterium]|nr:nucleotidyl transferase AbiEii/AbiGii toxin family protein [Anaerolineae bacterium]HQI86532.1 nucleotidyl transferase AbiEii/AbiGii toxin family protein [Anaerolineae bacterium]
MITVETIRALAAQFQTTELNVRREYFQHLFLSYFYQQPLTDQIYFTGGTALRVLYNSPRFSEDLDFSSCVLDIHTLEGIVVDTLAEIARENIEVDVAESKITSGGYLAIIAFAGSDMPVSVKLEISLREGEKRGEVVTIVSEFIPAYIIISLAREQLIEEKIQALLFRQKACDFYDLYFLLRANLVRPGERDALPQALETVKQSKIDFEQELKEFLPRNHRAILRGFQTTLAREIERFV